MSNWIMDLAQHLIDNRYAIECHYSRDEIARTMGDWFTANKREIVSFSDDCETEQDSAI